MPRRKVKFEVSFTMPERATLLDCRTYVEDALRSHCGSLEHPGGRSRNSPGDPFWSFDKESLVIKRNRGCKHE